MTSDTLRWGAGGSACAVPAIISGSAVPSPEGGAKRRHLRPQCSARALAPSHWSWGSCWRSPGLRRAMIKRRKSWWKNRPGQPRASLEADLARWLQDLPPIVHGPGWVPAGEQLPLGPSHLAENLPLPVAEVKVKESLPGRPRCSSITLFSQKPVQPRLVLGLWAGPPPTRGSPLPMVGCWWAHTQWGPAPRGFGGEVLGPTVGRNRLLPSLPSNLGTPAYVTATAAAGRAFVSVTVLLVVRIGPWAAFSQLLLLPHALWLWLLVSSGNNINASWHLFSTYFMPGINTWSSPKNWYSYPHFIGEEIEAQRS